MDARRAITTIAIVLSFFHAGATLAGDWTVQDPGQGAVALAPGKDGANELSGLTWIGENRYVAVSDKQAKLFSLTIDLSPDGKIANAAVTGAVALAAGSDLEAIAFEKQTGMLLVADEDGPAIRQHRGADGNLLKTLTVPPTFTRARKNLSLESLALGGPDDSLWIANEEALEGDGPTATDKSGTLVRLQRFDREHAPAGQWPYQTDPYPPLPNELAKAARSRQGSGVVELIVLEDGTLIALERAAAAGLRARLFQVDTAGATDTTQIENLAASTLSFARKTELWSYTDAAHNFEGAALGPQIGDARSLILVSDDGGDLQQALYPLLLRPVICGDGKLEKPETCDDGNRDGGDGCSPGCRIEVCGDGVRNNRGSEHCDDGNTRNGDGCSDRCDFEDQVRVCHDALLTGARDYAFDRIKALRSCRDRLNDGRPVFADRERKLTVTDPQFCLNDFQGARRIQQAVKQFRSSLSGGTKARCTAQSLQLLKPCAETVDGLVNSDGTGGCLLKAQDAAVDAILDAEYGRPLTRDDDRERRCQEAIAKAAGEYAEARWRAIYDCRRQWFKGARLYADESRAQPVAGEEDCTSEFRTVRRITRAAQKIRPTIAPPGRTVCTDELVQSLGGLCASTVDGLADPSGEGGCLIDSHNRAIDSAFGKRP